MTNDRAVGFLLIVIIVAVALFYGTIGYVVVHFIEKFW